MADIRAALKTKLASLTYDGVSPKAYDHNSTEEVIANLEAMVLAEPGGTFYVGIALGDDRTAPTPYSWGRALDLMEIDVLMIESRASQVDDMEQYAKDLASGIDRSDLDISNVLDCKVISKDPVYKETTSGGVTHWIKQVTVQIKHLVVVNTGGNFRVNADPPVITIDTDAIDNWFSEGFASAFSMNATVTSGTGTPTAVLLGCQFESDGNQEQLFNLSRMFVQPYTSDGVYSVEITATVGTGIAAYPGSNYVFYAIVYDGIYMSYTDTYTVEIPA